MVDPQEHRFEIDTDVADILADLRKNNLQWIADEVEGRIWAGTSMPAPESLKRQKTSKNAIVITGLSPADQVNVLLRAIHAYLILAPQVWTEATYALQETLAKSAPEKVIVSLAEPGLDSQDISVDVPEKDDELDASRATIESHMRALRLLPEEKR